MNPWPVSWPIRLVDPFPADANRAGKYGPIAGTIPFWNVYSKVTAKLRKYGRDQNDVDIEEFLEFLIGGFYAKYESWNDLDGAAEYFEFFKKARFRSLSLVAHAYFHMGYDLPQTIAELFVAAPNPEILAFGRNKARQTFLALNYVFPEVFAEESKSYSTNGIFGLLGKIIPSGVIGIPSYWVLDMRAVAFINAEILADEPNPTKKAQIEAQILECVVKAGRELKRNRWNPVLWLTLLPAPTLSAFQLAS
jgi:hypothetical protein